MVETFGYTLEEIAIAFDSTTSLPTAGLVEQAKRGQLRSEDAVSQDGEGSARSTKGRDEEQK